MKIAHIINPIRVKTTSDLYVAQPITFESLRIAQLYAANKVQVELYTAQYPEDKNIIPEFFHKTNDLKQSILDFGQFESPRKLPFLKDILDRLYETSDAEYFIYSNVDIAVQPHFYRTIHKFIENGYDAFVINRRTISNKYTSLEELDLMYSEIGESHPGHDCFVFPKKDYPKYTLGNVCLGASWVGRVLIWNLFLFAQNPVEFSRQSLTFHIGNDKVWKNKKFSAYFNFNRKEAKKIHINLSKQIGDVVPNLAKTLIGQQLLEELTEPLKERTKNLYRKSLSPIDSIPLDKKRISFISKFISKIKSKL